METAISAGLGEDMDGVDEGHCSICLANALRQPTTVGPCGHTFCLECIRQWTASRVDPKCPLCNARVLSLCHVDHEEEPVEGQSASSAREVVEAVDLGCLDHAYFQAEIQRLLQRTLATQGWINRRSRGGGGDEAVRMAEASSALRNVQTTLSSFGTLMEAEAEFEPRKLLDELYSLDHVIRSHAPHTWFRPGVSSIHAEHPDQGQRQVLSAEDAADELEEEDDEDCDLDDDVGYQLRPGVANRFENRQAHMGRTPGRKPLGRAKKKKGGSVRL